MTLTRRSALALPALALFPATALAAPAPGFSLKDADGRVRILTEFRGKVVVLEGPHVAVALVDAVDHKDLHTRYQIEAVPIVAVADAAGVVQASFIGPVSSTHLWGALAELREPGSVPDGCGAAGGDHDHDHEHDHDNDI